jgi:2'-5' RNA ligase
MSYLDLLLKARKMAPKQPPAEKEDEGDQPSLLDEGFEPQPEDGEPVKKGDAFDDDDDEDEADDVPDMGAEGEGEGEDDDVEKALRPHGVFVFLSIPEPIRSSFPQDPNSPHTDYEDVGPHVTLFWHPCEDAAEANGVAEALKGAVKDFKGCGELSLASAPSYFRKPDYWVAYLGVAGHDLWRLRWVLEEAARAVLGEEARGATDYTPHATLAYQPPGEWYDGPLPQGAFKPSTVHIHVDGKLFCEVPLS